MSTRRRRSPEEARAEILEAAEARLREHGLDGLNVVDVAAACGMSHATVIHHFGSTAGMRSALVARMSDRLLRDLIAALERDGDPPGARVLLEDLFETLSSGGHAKLLAWLAVGGEDVAGGLRTRGDQQALFSELVTALARRLPGRSTGRQWRGA